MLENTQDIIKAILAVSGIFYVSRIYYQAQREHPVFHYDQHSTANVADWRWRKPDEALGLRLEDDENKSCLHFPLQLLFVEKGCIGAGYLCALFTVVAFTMLFMRDAGWPEYLIAGVFAFLSIVLVNVGNRVSSIALYPEHLVIVENYAFFLKRMLIYKHHPQLSFKGASQSLLELTTSHTEPDFKLYIKRRYFYIFWSQRSLLLSLNQSQGSWLVEGLEYWRNHAGILMPQLKKY